MFGFGNLKTLAAAAVLVMAAGVASAATCSIGGVNFTLTTSVGQTCVAGNDLGRNGIVANNMTLFGLDDWRLGDSSDASASQTGSVEFNAAPIVNVSSGLWSILGYNGFDPLMIVLKAGDHYGAFLISTATSGLGGTWSITRDAVERQCIGRGQRRVCVNVPVLKPVELSHTSLYHQRPPTPTPIPIPAAGLLLLGALGGLAALRRRRAA